MNRSARVIVAVLALLLLVAGTAFAVRNPVALEHRSPVAASHDPSASGSADESAGTGEDQNEDENEADEQDADGPPSAELLAKLLDRLSIAGIDTDEATLSDLIGSSGVGGAVRLLAWSDASGTSVADLQQMRSDGMGWGQIAKQLNDANQALQLSPGIGWVMSGGHGQGHGQGHGAASDKADGRSTAPGQNKH